LPQAGSSSPSSTAEPNCRRVIRNPPRHATTAASTAPARRNRVPADNSGGIDSMVNLMPR